MSEQSIDKKEESAKPLSTLERISRIEEAVGGTKMAIQSINETSMYAMEKSLSLEASLASVAKLLTALLKELTDIKVVTNDNVYNRMRAADEDADREKLANMKKSGMLEEKDTVGEMSLVVVGSTLVNTTTGDVKVLSNFMTLDLAVIPPGDVTKTSLVGQKADASIELGQTADGSKILYTVKEIYEIKAQQVAGEDIKDNSKG